MAVRNDTGRGRASLQSPGQASQPPSRTPLRTAFPWKDFQLSKAPSASAFSSDPPALLGGRYIVAQSVELAGACTHLLLSLEAKRIRRG